MSDVIRLLPESIANQIAAGEVVPAPAYIVKELLENSIDAGASEVQVEIIGAGREAVQVTDNGKGMSPTDARMAFERHATSKLREIEDLDRLSTMGFRGEALAAIASVCQVELRTRIAELEVGTELRIEGARVKSSVPVACPVGTTLRAMNIFYNTPGRRKHIEARKESTELGDIWKEFAKVALANAEVSFALRGTGKYDKSLPASSLKERIIGIGGSKLSKALIPVNYESSFCSIRGFIGTPTTALKSGAQQYFFVNNRFIRHPYFHKAVMLAYEKFIPVGTQPHYFLYFTIPAENIDVNIHPQKTDVRFLDGETIFQVIVSLLREAFSSHALAPTIDFDQVVQEIGRRLEELSGLDFLADQDFLMRLHLHLQGLVERLRFDLELPNAFFHDLKRQYPLVFDIAVNISTYLGNILETDLNEEEIGLIAVHIGASYSHLMESRKIPVYLLAPKNYSLVTSSLERLEQRFAHRIQIVEQSDCETVFRRPQHEYTRQLLAHYGNDGGLQN